MYDVLQPEEERKKVFVLRVNVGELQAVKMHAVAV